MVTGWKRSTVKDISTIFGRIGFRGYTKDDIVEAYEGAISLSPSNLKDGKIDVRNSTFISWHKYNESPEIKLKNGDVVLVKTGSTYGKSAYVDNLKWATTLNPQIVVFKNIKLNNKLFAYFVQTPEFQKQIEATIVGGAIPTLSQNQVYQFEIIFPIDEEEQNRIAEALSDVDSMISSLEKLIAKKKAVKQGAMQELLTGKKRLPGFTGEWVEKRIENIAEVGRGRVISHIEISKNIGGNYPVYSSQTTNNGIMGYLRTYDFDGDYITWTTDGVNAGTVFHRSGKFNCTNVCGTLKCRDVNTDFVARRLGVETPNYVATNLANPKLMNDVMKRIIITLPPTIEEQTAIASILSDMDNEIEALEQKLAKTRQVKQGMMQQLLTGKIRLV